MEPLPLLLILTAIVLQRCSSIGSDATINASGETIVAEEAPCEPRELLDGRLSSCDVVQIATLRSSPRRCLHIEAPPPPGDNADVSICKNFKDWFDGTNGCKAYSNDGWCDKFGNVPYPPHTEHAAKEACCACGGGTRVKPRLLVGDHVKLKGYGKYDGCEWLKIVEVRAQPRFHYVVQVMKPCPNLAFQPGKQLNIGTDARGVIDRRIMVELKKCRAGKGEQEFEMAPPGAEEGGDVFSIRHRLTGFDLATSFDAKSTLVNVTQAFGDGLFEGSGDFFSLRIQSKGRGSTWSHLASGKFGKEYSTVQAHSILVDKYIHEQEFSMWGFQPVPRNESEGDGGLPAVDDHAEWLVRMSQMIGIDYLTQLSPWHLLDVDRDASKGDVKSRFRELGRSFHPDKLVDRPEKRALFEGIFVLLQNAYQNLKSADEAEKEKFKAEAESGSQLFSHSQFVIELLPFHWTKLEEAGGDISVEGGAGRYILNAASHLNLTLFDISSPGEESDPSVQIWVTFMYSARCGMSHTVTGMVDLAAMHLERHENIKVGAYGCGLYKDFPPKGNDPIGVKSDPICAQFQRSETPNVHVIVETIPGRKRDENGAMTTVPPDPELARENAQFKYFYAAVPHGNTTQFFPHNIIDFARAGKRAWQNGHLVHRMTTRDFGDPRFVGNVSIVAFLDGTGNGETDSEVADAIARSLPGVARRFLRDHVYAGITRCGHGDEIINDEMDPQSQKNVDCSVLDVSWLPEVKIYGANETDGFSLLRGPFSDVRDVQIALESMGNVLRMMLGGMDDDHEDELEENQEDESINEGGGGCGNDQQPPPPPGNDLDLDEIEGRTDDSPLLEMGPEREPGETKPALETGPNPAPGQEDVPKKPKLAGGDDRPRLSGGREHAARDRISGFQQRKTKQVGSGQLLGGGSGGSAGFIA